MHGMDPLVARNIVCPWTVQVVISDQVLGPEDGDGNQITWLDRLNTNPHPARVGRLINSSSPQSRKLSLPVQMPYSSMWPITINWDTHYLQICTLCRRVMPRRPPPATVRSGPYLGFPASRGFLSGSQAVGLFEPHLSAWKHRTGTLRGSWHSPTS